MAVLGLGASPRTARTVRGTEKKYTAFFASIFLWLHAHTQTHSPRSREGFVGSEVWEDAETTVSYWHAQETEGRPGRVSCCMQCVAYCPCRL
jgi:hypothetical protein